MRGFSLVELSIVLVILGLLTGGILAGQSLIRAAELRSLTTQTSQYMAAVHTFRDRYLSLPGDMQNAVKFWGAQAGTTNDGRDAICAALTTESTSVATCNGDGNGLIGNTSNSYYERFRFWQHLANAGLVEGSYSGIPGPHTSGEQPVLGVNVPSSRVSNVGFHAQYLAVSANFFGPINANIFTVGTATTLWTLGTGSSALGASEVWNIDTKLDDGRPSSGRIQHRMLDGTPGAPSNCLNYTSAADAEYRLTNTNSSCSYLVIPGF